jgi:apolipoprotein N-acyltransferase
LIYGKPFTFDGGGKSKTLVTAFFITPKGETSGYASKMHLVPLADTGIYLPFIKLTRGKLSYEPGSELNLFQTPKGNFSVSICFDSLFPELVNRMLKTGAQFMVSIADDSFSNSPSEHYQHASMLPFRSVENRIYYVRAANSGVTMAIDPCGRIIKSLPIFTPGYLVVDIGTKRGKTFYSEYGDVVGYFSFIFVFGLSLVALGLGFESLGRKPPEK